MSIGISIEAANGIIAGVKNKEVTLTEAKKSLKTLKLGSDHIFLKETFSIIKDNLDAVADYMGSIIMQDAKHDTEQKADAVNQAANHIHKALIEAKLELRDFKAQDGSGVYSGGDAKVAEQFEDVIQELEGVFQDVIVDDMSPLDKEEIKQSDEAGNLTNLVVQLANDIDILSRGNVPPKAANRKEASGLFGTRYGSFVMQPRLENNIARAREDYLAKKDSVNSAMRQDGTELAKIFNQYREVLESAGITQERLYKLDSKEARKDEHNTELKAIVRDLSNHAAIKRKPFSPKLAVQTQKLMHYLAHTLHSEPKKSIVSKALGLLKKRGAK